jgi:hypothetical protein
MAKMKKKMGKGLKSKGMDKAAPMPKKVSKKGTEDSGTAKGKKSGWKDPEW